MGNVEWVTCHVPASHSAAGGCGLFADAAVDFAEESVWVEGCRSSTLDGDNICCTAEDWGVGSGVGAASAASVTASDITEYTERKSVSKPWSCRSM